MRKSLILATMLTVGSSLMAQSVFVGLDAVNSDMSASIFAQTSSGSASMSDSDRDTNLKLKIGLDDVLNGRVYLKTGKVYDDGNFNYKSTTINYDYYFSEKDNTKLFVGAGIGQGKVELYNYSGTGAEYGVRFGGMMSFNNLSLEMGLGYTKASADFTITSGTDYAKVEAKNYSELFVGINYKF